MVFLPSELTSLERLSKTATKELPSAVRHALAAARGQPHYWRSPASLARFVFNTAVVLHKRGVRGDALQLFRESLAGLTETLGWQHDETREAAACLINCLAELGIQAHSEPLVLEHLLAKFRHEEGEESESTLEALRMVARDRYLCGDHKGAEALAQEGLASLSRLAVDAGLPPDAPPPQLLAVWTRLHHVMSKVLIVGEHFDVALVTCRKVLTTLDRLPASEETAALVLLMNVQLGSAFFHSDDMRAEQVFKDALPKLHGQSDYGIIAFMLSEILLKRGLVNESRKYLDKAEKALPLHFAADTEVALQLLAVRDKLEVAIRTCSQCSLMADSSSDLKSCSACKAARYCSAACQKLHWKTHKKACERIVAEKTAMAAGSGGAGPSGDGLDGTT